MLFNSSEFAVFFPVVAAVFFALPHRFRWLFLLGASYFFYMCWKPGYVILILLTTTVDYWVAILMGKTPHRRLRRRYLLLSLATNLGLLAFFKYFGFFNEIIGELLALGGIELTMPPSPFLLPVGISFYTFQSLSYIFEVYKGRQEPERHFGRFALYVSFFPQLVAGPIERPQHMLPQYRLKQVFDYDRVTNSLKLMAWGLFKKVVIADRLAQFVDQIYENPAQHDGAALSLATVFFAFQIFCDFSGYSDIAVGAAGVLGFDLINNFRRPYFAASISDFWHRWHISLSTWFRDYVYIPLGGSRVEENRWYANILIVFLVSGLWHGAAWKFMAWGLIHGVYMVFGRILQPPRQRIVALLGLDRLPVLRHALQIILTFFLVCYAWIFFRANTMQDALYISTHLLQGWGETLSPGWFENLASTANMPVSELVLSVMLIVLLMVGQILSAHEAILMRLARKPIWLRWTAYSGLMWCIFIYGVFRHKEFIYFTF